MNIFKTLFVLLALPLLPFSVDADSTTTRWGLTVIDVGSTNWGPKINTNISTLDNAAGLSLTNAFTGLNSFSLLATFGTGLQGNNGSAGAPTYSFTNFPTSGWYINAGPIASLSVAGADQLKVSATSSTINVPLTSNGGATALADHVTFTDATGQTYYLGGNNSSSAGQYILAINRDPVTGTFSKTGQGSSFIQIDSGNGVGSTTIRAGSTNNVTPTVVATFKDTGVGITGTTTNDNATAGNYGESISSAVASGSAVSAPGSNQLFDVASITLTAGDWDISAVTMQAANSATTTEFSSGVGTVTGNNSTGMVLGDTRADGPSSTSGNPYDVTQTLPGIRKSIAGSTTYYLKALVVYSGGTPKAYGRISARRVR